MLKILLTGGSGFVGKNIQDSYLSQKYNIFAPSHNVLDLKNKKDVIEYIKKLKPDTIIHTALTTNLRDNFLIDNNILELDGCHIINLSSGAIYGRQEDIHLAKEEDIGKRIPQDDYGFYKYIMHRNNSIITNLILFGIFGKYELSSRFISSCINRLQNNKKPVIYENRIMSYIDIRDFLSILDSIILSYITGTYNIVSDHPIDLFTLSTKICTLFNRDDLQLEGISSNISEYTGNGEIIKKKLKDHIKFSSWDDSILYMINILKQKNEL
jgi:dTDP-4-dehydrorhamnose reductase